MLSTIFWCRWIVSDLCTQWTIGQSSEPIHEICWAIWWLRSPHESHRIDGSNYFASIVFAWSFSSFDSRAVFSEIFPALEIANLAHESDWYVACSGFCHMGDLLLLFLHPFHCKSGEVAGQIPNRANETAKAIAILWGALLLHIHVNDGLRWKTVMIFMRQVENMFRRGLEIFCLVSSDTMR